MLDAVDEGFGQGVLLDQLEEGALDVGIGDHEIAAHLLAIGKDDAGGAAAAGHDARHIGPGADRAARCLEGGGERLRHRAHAAARIAPGADGAIDFAHIVMQEHVSRAGRHRPKRRADNA